jgi:ABC-type glycerol-3-phosphate transport system substrate-binding protein
MESPIYDRIKEMHVVGLRDERNRIAGELERIIGVTHFSPHLTKKAVRQFIKTLTGEQTPSEQNLHRER